MEYANEIKDITNAFSGTPLSGADLDTFYCDKTMEVRMNDAWDSPIEEIFEECHVAKERNAFLLLGHGGCGKSTELNKMSERLIKDEYPVRTIQCGENLDLQNPAYADLFILMGEALLDIAQKCNCKINEEAEKTIRDFWIDVEQERTVSTEADAEIEAGIKAKNPLFDVIKLFANAHADLKYNEENRKIYREQIRKRISHWLSAMNDIAGQIAERLEGRQPVIIFEDLDKLEKKEAWEVFENNARKLTGFSFPVIYTFPIALSYDSRFKALEGYFNVQIFPMIKVTDMNDQPYTKGLAIIREIVTMRAKENLFDNDALNLMIRMTGGSLRDLFRAIITCATRVRRRGGDKILMEDAERALEKQKSMLTRRIERKHYDFLVDIYSGNRMNIENREMLLEMLRAGVVLEYNGQRWHNVHPLVAEYLREQGLTGNG